MHQFPRIRLCNDLLFFVSECKARLRGNRRLNHRDGLGSVGLKCVLRVSRELNVLPLAAMFESL